jgi:isocitrate lyase
MHTRIVEFELLIIGDKEEGFGGEVDNMALAAESVHFGIVLDVISA